MRTSEIVRNTKETQIKLSLNLDGEGIANIDTGCAFLDHMLTLFASHGGFDLEITCKGDTNVDFHHTTEDVAICLGKAFADSLGDKMGISRYGYMILPMDEALVLASVDFSGRAYLNYELSIPSAKVGDFDTELCAEFWLGFTREANCTLHLNQMAGKNSHHIIEAAFKSAARAIRQAVGFDDKMKGKIPSTKGVL